MYVVKTEPDLQASKFTSHKKITRVSRRTQKTKQDLEDGGW